MPIELPIMRHRTAIQAAVNSSATTILIAPPGTGKTTEAPQFIADSLTGRIMVLEPRRLAARLSAERIARLRGSPLGSEVGYWIRHDRKFSADTRIVFLTEGVFVQLLQSNPRLDGIAAVILDEVHERSIHTDIAMGFLRQRQIQGQRCPKVMLMSATLDVAELSELFDSPQLVQIESPLFPVKTVYRPTSPPVYGQYPAYARQLLRAIVESGQTRHTLVFLTGIGEIRSIQSALRSERLADDFDILAIAASVDQRDQERVFAPSERRKIILSTNVAETSVTIPEVDLVIDSGLAKVAGYTAWSALPTIEVQRVSQSSCIQRAGRAGRTGPGTAIRLYSEVDFRQRPTFDLPEIQRSDITQPLLQILSLSDAQQPGNTIDQVIDAFPWPARPQLANLKSTCELLRILQITSSEGKLTPRGRFVSGLPIHPRLGSMWSADKDPSVQLTEILCMVMVSEDFLNENFQPNAEGSHCDIQARLHTLHQILIRQQPETLGRQDAERLHVRLRPSFDQIARHLGALPEILTARPDEFLTGSIMLRGFPDRVAQAQVGRDKDRTFRFCRGGGGEVSRQSLAGASAYIICLSLRERLKADRSERLLIERAARIELEELQHSSSPYLNTLQVSEETPSGSSVCEVQRYGELELTRKRLKSEALGAEAIFRRLKAQWPAPFPSDQPLLTYNARALIFNRHFPDSPLPIFVDDMLELFQSSIASDYGSLQKISETPLLEIIDSQLSYDLAQQLKTECPEQARLPNGKVLKIDYLSAAGPLLTGPIQDFYGCLQLPDLCAGKEKLTVELLGPNKRPMQRTRDLASFWAKTYSELLKEYQRNYPRHYWPADPTKAQPFLLVRHLPKP